VADEPKDNGVTPQPEDGEQLNLFNAPAAWSEKWEGMPEFSLKNLKPYDTINVQFRSAKDMRAFLVMLGEAPARAKSIWYPKLEYLKQSVRNAAPTVVPANRYPIYVISKGRWQTPLTARALLKLGIPFYLVVEPQERDQYAAALAPVQILALPFSNLGQGSIPARNFVWEHALSSGAERHWILDDNIDGFYRLNNNLKVKVISENPFTFAEDFSDRYLNVAISGLNYEFFADRRSIQPPFILNTRVYSCILIRNDLPYRWRGRYNEDTDLCLRALKDGHCTILFNAFLAKKMPTMTMKGGNTEELYDGDGRLLMAQSLQEQHPDVVTITRKWNRWQHQVDYRRFKRNKLILKLGAIAPSEIEANAPELTGEEPDA
jgi:hypothetical protein